MNDGQCLWSEILPRTNRIFLTANLKPKELKFRHRVPTSIVIQVCAYPLPLRNKYNGSWRSWKHSLAELPPPRTTQVWALNDDHSGHRVVAIVPCWLNPTLHGNAWAIWFSQSVSDPLAVNYLLQSQACHEQVIYYQQVSTLFPKGNLFFSSCAIHFWMLAYHYNYSLFKPMPHTHTRF